MNAKIRPKFKLRGSRDGRPSKNANENPVPRKASELPDIDEVLKNYQPTIDKVCEDIHKNWYHRAWVPEIKEEILQTVLLFFYTEWFKFREGIKDEFPPCAAFLYISANWMFHAQYAPRGDIYRYVGVVSYDTINEAPEAEFTGNLILVDKTSREVAEQRISELYKEPDEVEDAIFNGFPDLVDFWFIGFTIKELAMVYDLHPNTIRARLHSYYDAMEFNGYKTFRKRPRRVKCSKNRKK